MRLSRNLIFKYNAAGYDAADSEGFSSDTIKSALMPRAREEPALQPVCKLHFQTQSRRDGWTSDVSKLDF